MRTLLCFYVKSTKEKIVGLGLCPLRVLCQGAWNYPRSHSHSVTSSRTCSSPSCFYQLQGAGMSSGRKIILPGTVDILLIQHTKVKLGQKQLKQHLVLEICMKFSFQSRMHPENRSKDLTSLGWLAMAMVPSVLYLIGAPPSCTSVP